MHQAGFSGRCQRCSPSPHRALQSVVVPGFSASLCFGPSRAFSIVSPWLGRGMGCRLFQKNPSSFQGRLQAYGFFHKPSAGRGWNLLPGSPWLQEVQTPFLHQGDELGPATLPCGPRQVTLAGLSLPILKLGTIGTSPGGPVVRIHPSSAGDTGLIPS